MSKMYIRILRFLTDGSSSETTELIMRTGTTTTMLQQMSPGFVNKNMRLMNKKNDKIPSGNPPCDDELIGILLLSSSCSQKALCSVSFRSGVGGSSFFNVPQPRQTRFDRVGYFTSIRAVGRRLQPSHKHLQHHRVAEGHDTCAWLPAVDLHRL